MADAAFLVRLYPAAIWHGSKPMVPFWGRCTTHFRTYFSGWIGIFTGGTIWILTHGDLFSGLRVCSTSRPGLLEAARSRRPTSAMKSIQQMLDLSSSAVEGNCGYEILALHVLLRFLCLEVFEFQ